MKIWNVECQTIVTYLGSNKNIKYIFIQANFFENFTLIFDYIFIK